MNFLRAVIIAAEFIYLTGHKNGKKEVIQQIRRRKSQQQKHRTETNPKTPPLKTMTTQQFKRANEIQSEVSDRKAKINEIKRLFECLERWKHEDKEIKYQTLIVLPGGFASRIDIDKGFLLEAIRNQNVALLDRIESLEKEIENL